MRVHCQVWLKRTCGHIKDIHLGSILLQSPIHTKNTPLSIWSVSGRVLAVAMALEYLLALFTNPSSENLSVYRSFSITINFLTPVTLGVFYMS